MTLRLRALIASLLLAPALPGLGSFGDPAGFLANEQISETVLHPGVKYIRADGTHGGRPMVTHVVTVDLTTPGVRLQMLPGERLVSGSTQFFRRSRVSHLQQDNNAIAAINTAFFDISNPGTMAPRGLNVRDGMVLREPAGNRPSLAVTENGTAFLADFLWQRSVRRGTSSVILHGVNSEVIGNSTLNLYQYPWDRSPGRDAAIVGGRAITEVVLGKLEFEKSARWNERHVLRGQVLHVRNDQASVSLTNPNLFVLTGTGSARNFLQSMQVGEVVEVDWILSGQPASIDWQSISEISSGWHVLIRNGALQNVSGTEHRDIRHPRSAVGINSTQSRVLFVLVEGRQTGRAEGMSLTSLRNYMNHMQAHDALEFDGGGSSALAGRIDGADRLLSTPSDGSERYVPAGFGVVADEEAPHPFFQDIAITTGKDGAVISWTTPEPATAYGIYGTEGYDLESTRNLSPATRHTVLLSDLPQERHFIRLVANVQGDIITSHGIEFTPGEYIVDDVDAAFTGNWNTGLFPVYYGSGYRWTATTSGSPTHTATFRPELPVTGYYDVYVWYVPGGNRTTDARHEVRHASGTNLISISQRTGGNGWELLAPNRPFYAGTEGYVRVRNDSSDGTVVMADAVRWLLRNAAPQGSGQVPQWWARHFFGNDAPPSGVDGDGDGLTLWEEFVWGTEPNNPESRPDFNLTRLNPTTLRLTVQPFRADRIYVLETSVKAGGEWTPLEIVPIHWQNSLGIYNIPDTADDRRFYRVRASLP